MREINKRGSDILKQKLEINQASEDYKKFDKDISTKLKEMRRKRDLLKKRNQQINKNVSSRFKTIQSK
jgi:hypothetical protein